MWQTIKLYTKKAIAFIREYNTLFISGAILSVSISITNTIWQLQLKLISPTIDRLCTSQLIALSEYKTIIYHSAQLCAYLLSAYCTFKLATKLFKVPITAATLTIASLQLSNSERQARMREIMNVPESAIATFRLTDSITESAKAQAPSSTRDAQLASLCDIASPDNLD